MITCPNCQHQEVEGTLFCSECGSILTGARVLSTQELPRSQSGLNFNSSELSHQPPVRTTTGLNTNISLHIVESGKILHLENRGYFTLGRTVEDQPVHPDIDMTPFDAYGQGVSRLHAAVKVINNRVFITDLGSSNGTRVNGQKIAAQLDYPLNHGDMVALGKLKIQFLFH